MLRGPLIHPGILEALASAGHGSRVLVADGNYPFSTGASPAARRVHLNLTPGTVSVPAILAALAKAIPIEKAQVMQPAEGPEPAIFAELRQILGPDLPLSPLGRFEFYDAARQSDTALVIASAEQRVYANVLLTIGVVMP